MTESSTAVCPESTIESANRRNFIKKAALATAAVGVGGVLLDKSLSVLPESSAGSASVAPVCTNTPGCNAGGSLAVFDSCHVITGATRSTPATLTGCVCGGPVLNVTNSASNGYAVCVSGPSKMIYGSCNHPTLSVLNNACSRDAVGILGSGGSCGIGVQGKGGNIGVQGLSFGGSSVPIVAIGSSSQTANLQQWEKTKPACAICTSPTILSAVNSCGWLGIATSSPKTTLQVNGGVSVGTKIETSCYLMGSTDFAVLACAASNPVVVTLPPASNKGQLVHVKKIDSSSNHVTVAGQNSDKIECSATKSLPTQYHQLTLIAGGNGNWYILATAK